MKICPECGKEIEKNSKFCPSCGLIFFSTLPKHSPISEDGRLHPPPEAAGSAQKNEDTTRAVKDSQKKCPDCGKKVDKSALACTGCGLIFYSKPAQPVHVHPIRQTPTSGNRYSTQFIWASLIACLILGFYFFKHLIVEFIEKNPSSAPLLLRAIPTDTPEFDLTIEVIKHPSGLTWNEREFVLGNKDAQSFLTVARSRDQYTLREAIVGDTLPLAWNGLQFVGYRESGMFESYKNRRFTIHDASSLKVLHEYPAPEAIGGLAWDGTGFWAGTRNVKQEQRGILYRLDRNLKVVNKMVSPSSTCSGLAWDGSYLWFLDDAQKKIYVLDVKGVQVRMIGSFEIPLRSASGIVFDGQNIWIADYDQRCLFRLKPIVRALWTPDELRRTQNPNVEGKRANRDTSSDAYLGSVNGSKDDVEVASFSARLISNDLFVSWDIHFGENLFYKHSKEKQRQPTFAKITVTVDGGTLSDPIAKAYDAYSGRMHTDSMSVFPSLGSGMYHVRLFIYIQYTDKEGKGRVLSKSIPPLKVIN